MCQTKQQPSIVIVVALDREGGIGRENQLLCHIPEDLAHFKKLTMGGVLVMGRRTYESIGRPLPGRRTIVLTSQNSNTYPAEVTVVHSVSELLELAHSLEHIFVAGGAQVYKALFPYATEAYITRIDAVLQADTFFPYALDPDQWQEESVGAWQSSKASDLNFRFEYYRRLRIPNL